VSGATLLSLRYAQFPDRKNCPDYAREPGSDDDGAGEVM
jgi:hypothetical protein